MPHSAARSFILMLVVAGTSSCAVSGTQAGRTAAPLLGTPSCLWISDIRHWDVIDPSTLIVYAPMPKDAYLVRLFQPIPDLIYHESLGFEDGNHNGQICSLGDELMVRGAFPLRVPISAVRALTLTEVKQLKAASKGISSTPATSGSIRAIETRPTG
jgi:hypothetical protein